MYCKHCGNKLTDNANFCNKCGKIIEQEIAEDVKKQEEFDFFGDINEPMQEERKTFFTDTQDERVREAAGKSILKFSILGIAFGQTIYFALLGLIFSYIARKKIKRYKRKYGEFKGAAAVGRGINIGAMITSWVSIGLMIFYILYFILMIAGIVDSSTAPTQTTPYFY